MAIEAYVLPEKVDDAAKDQPEQGHPCHGPIDWRVAGNAEQCELAKVEIVLGFADLRWTGGVPTHK